MSLRLLITSKVHVYRYLFYAILLHSTVTFAQDPQTILEVHKKAIRNGSLTPTSISLSAEQQKAIGWMFVGSPQNRFCTATVISANAILTARHCFYGKDGPPLSSNFKFAILSDQGIRNQEQNPIQNPFEPEEVFSFTSDNLLVSVDYDLAVIRFPNSPFNRAGLTPIPINTNDLKGEFKQNLLSSYVDVAGFGDTQHNNEKGRYFASVKLELITPTYLITNGENEQGICRGDSGGPLLAAGTDGEVTILAVVTNGDKCCVGFDQLTRVDLEAELLVQFGGAFTSTGQPFPKECWGISRKFRCTKNVLHFCAEGQLGEKDCQEDNQICAYDIEDNRFDCVDRSALCPLVMDSNGRCINSTTLERCEYGQTREIQCVNAACQMIDDGRRPACVPFTSSNTEDLICDESNYDRLEWASEAKFSSEAACTAKDHSPTLPLFFMIIFGLIFRKNKKENII